MTRNVLSRRYGRVVWFRIVLRKPEPPPAPHVGLIRRLARALQKLREDEVVTKPESQ